MTKRASFGQAVKEAALRLAQEAERFIGASDATLCSDTNCKHPRSRHCGCGTVCLDYTDGGTAKCECQGFVASKESDV